MSAFLISIYDIALIVLQWLGGEVGTMGFGYFVANIVIFVFVQPSLITPSPPIKRRSGPAISISNPGPWSVVLGPWAVDKVVDKLCALIG